MSFNKGTYALRRMPTANSCPTVPSHCIASVRAQVAHYNDHGILLGVHGAGFINCMFMRQGSSVIEIFPYHLKHTLYQRQAYAAGLTHFSVYATDPKGARVYDHRARRVQPVAP